MGKKKLIVADIHGQISIFRHIYRYILNITQKDKKWEIGFIGDYADRGEHGELNQKRYDDIGSREVYLLLFELKEYFNKKGIAYFFLRGNHERELLGYIEDKGKTTLNYMASIEKAYEGMRAEPSIIKEVKKFLDDTVLYRFDGEHNQLFVHAGVDPEKENILESDPSYFLWARNHFYDSCRRYPHRVVFGHTKMSTPLVKEDRIGIDGGAYENGWLNVLLLDKERAEIISFNKEGDIVTRYRE